MLQNRADPSGKLIKTKARGAWLGNRGVIHNADKQIVRPFKLKAWIICELEFRGRHREIMVPDRWTELFFFDEATAFSAGHRPCFQCRYGAHQKFKTAWLKGNPEYGFDAKTPISKIDEIMHRERVNSRKEKVTYPDKANNLPNGTFMLYKDQPHLVFDNALHLWTPFGYTDKLQLPDAEVVVLTPKSVVNAFRAGYAPHVALP